MPKLLTKKKQRWVKQFKPTASIKGAPLKYNIASQNRYVKKLTSLVNDIIEETEKEVRKIYKTDASQKYFETEDMGDVSEFTMDASIASIARINMNALINKITKSVNHKSVTMAERMVNDVDQNSKTNLHASLKELSGGLSIKTNINSGVVNEAFKASVDVNADLIQTISANYLDQVKGAVNRSVQQGGGIDALISNIDKLLDDQARKTLNKAKNVALDQTRKAYNSLNAARMEKIGVKQYEWVHSGGGQTPRPHHKTAWPNGLNGGVFSLDDPPIIDTKTGERGIPGTAINCKCTMRPVISFDEGEPEP